MVLEYMIILNLNESEDELRFYLHRKISRGTIVLIETEFTGDISSISDRVSQAHEKLHWA